MADTLRLPEPDSAAPCQRLAVQEGAYRVVHTAGPVAPAGCDIAGQSEEVGRLSRTDGLPFDVVYLTLAVCSGEDQVLEFRFTYPDGGDVVEWLRAPASCRFEQVVVDKRRIVSATWRAHTAQGGAVRLAEALVFSAP